MSNLIPGEIIPEQGEIELNLGKEVKTVTVSNSGDRPVQIGSHYHFFEANKALIFDRELQLVCVLTYLQEQLLDLNQEIQQMSN